MRTIWRRNFGAHDLEELVAHPSRHGFVIGDVDRADKVRDEGGRVFDLQRVVAEDPKSHDHAGLGVLDVVDAPAEGKTGVLPCAYEVQLGTVSVPAGRSVDEHPEERQFLGVDLVPARAHCPNDLACIDKQGHFVGVNDRPRELTDSDVWPFEDDLLFLVVGYRYELTAEQDHLREPPVLGLPSG